MMKIENTFLNDKFRDKYKYKYARHSRVIQTRVVVKILFISLFRYELDVYKRYILYYIACRAISS